MAVSGEQAYTTHLALKVWHWACAAAHTQAWHTKERAGQCAVTMALCAVIMALSDDPH